MSRLTWENWYRSNGCIYHMDRNLFQGVAFSTIFWTAMRTIFIDDDGNEGALYRGSVWAQSINAVARNGRQFGFDGSQQITMLFNGDFNYGSSITRLRFEGPELPDDAGAWASAPVPGFQINVNFYNMIDYGNANFGVGATAIDRMVWFTGAVVLHEVMHNQGFEHPDVADWTPGSDYASSLPHVALMSVLKVSPHRTFFDSLIDIEAVSTLQRFTFRQIRVRPNAADVEAAKSATALQSTLNAFAIREADLPDEPNKPVNPSGESGGF